MTQHGFDTLDTVQEPVCSGKSFDSSARAAGESTGNSGASSVPTVVTGDVENSQYLQLVATSPSSGEAKVLTILRGGEPVLFDVFLSETSTESGFVSFVEDIAFEPVIEWLNNIPRVGTIMNVNEVLFMINSTSPWWLTQLAIWTVGVKKRSAR
mgnify:CR=1 FL=1